MPKYILIILFLWVPLTHTGITQHLRCGFSVTESVQQIIVQTPVLAVLYYCAFLRKANYVSVSIRLLGEPRICSLKLTSPVFNAAPISIVLTGTRLPPRVVSPTVHSPSLLPLPLKLFPMIDMKENIFGNAFASYNRKESGPSVNEIFSSNA